MTAIELPEHRRRVEAWRQWLPTVWKFNVFGTLHLNADSVSLDYARRRLFRFLTDVQKPHSMFGKKFYNLPWRHRIDGIVVPEKIKESTHYHFLFQMPPHKIQTFNDIGERVWKKVTESGKFWLKEQTDPSHWERIISYATKETHKENNYQNLILVREFWHNPITFVQLA